MLLDFSSLKFGGKKGLHQFAQWHNKNKFKQANIFHYCDSTVMIYSSTSAFSSRFREQNFGSKK
jgi:hypothetical protein